MLEGGGFEVVDLGIDVAPEKFVEAVKERGAAHRAVGPADHHDALDEHDGEGAQEAGVRDQVKVMIGGAPVTEDYARQIGADGYAPDASSAVRLAKALVA